MFGTILDDGILINGIRFLGCFRLIIHTVFEDIFACEFER